MAQRHHVHADIVVLENGAARNKIGAPRGGAVDLGADLGADVDGDERADTR